MSPVEFVMLDGTSAIGPVIYAIASSMPGFVLLSLHLKALLPPNLSISGVGQNPVDG